MLDSMIKEKIKENVNMTVPLYLMMSYAYYIDINLGKWDKDYVFTGAKEAA